MLTDERMAEIAKLAIRLHHISGCAAITNSGETVFHHTFVDAILAAMNDVTAELLRYQTVDKQPAAAVLVQQVEVLIEEAKGAEQSTKLIFNAKNHWADRARAAEQLLQQPAIADVIAERQRQINEEGYTSGHDDTYENGELALAAAEYAIQAAVAPWDDDIEYVEHTPGKHWPWDGTWWKPTNQRRDLVKAGALILAEIERLDRAAASEEGL